VGFGLEDVMWMIPWPLDDRVIVGSSDPGKQGRRGGREGEDLQFASENGRDSG
jgi:hypothetical protein